MHAATYLRDITWEVLEEVVTSARGVMDWLKEVASITGRKNLPLEWVTPAGFHVKQEALRTKESYIYTVIQKIHMYPAETGKISSHRQQLCMPPNFVHSHDGSHLALTVCECLDRGVTSFATKHDAYGTHACDVSEMRSATRYRFVRMYTPDLLRQYWKEWQADTGMTLPEPDPRGEFDLTQVIRSLYFFS